MGSSSKQIALLSGAFVLLLSATSTLNAEGRLTVSGAGMRPAAQLESIMPAANPPIEAPAALEYGVYDPPRVFAGESNIGTDHVFVSWHNPNVRDLVRRIKYANKVGRNVVVTVEPFVRPGLTKSRLLKDITEGRYDLEIADVCLKSSMVRKGLLIRWGHEMEDDNGRYPWAQNKPGEYKEAFRYFTQECRKTAPRAQFVWSPKGEENLRLYYPGHKWVDVIGLSVWGLQAWDKKIYNRDRVFSDTFNEKYYRVANIGKPVIIAELGVSGDAMYRRRWLADLRDHSAHFPLLKKVVYFNMREPYPWPAGFGFPDWRISPSQLTSTGRNVSALAPFEGPVRK